MSESSSNISSYMICKSRKAYERMVNSNNYKMFHHITTSLNRFDSHLTSRSNLELVFDVDSSPEVLCQKHIQFRGLNDTMYFQSDSIDRYFNNNTESKETKKYFFVSSKLQSANTMCL